jgi:excisionase family DNA binding protein
MTTRTNEKPERRALSIEEAAEACGLSRATLYRLIADGRLVTLKIGARRLVPVTALDALLTRSAQ